MAETFSSIERLASAIRNDVVAGLAGYHTNFSMSMELLELDIIDERLAILKKYAILGILPLKDLYLAINCIPVDCESLDRCYCNTDDSDCEEKIAHFEIPLIMNDYGIKALDYVGSTDRLVPFIVYTSMNTFKTRKYRKRGKDKPSVYIDLAPNPNGYLDCFVFNAPLLSLVSVVGIFKDPRLLEKYSCCMDIPDVNNNFLDSEIKETVTKKKLAYYRQYVSAPRPNDQAYTPG